VIFESNSLMRFLRPNVYLVLLDYAVLDFKPSVKQFIDLADAYLVVKRDQERPVWQGVSLKPMTGKPVFEVAPPEYITPETVKFVRDHLR